MASTEASFVLAVDIGATKVLSVLARRDGTVLASDRQPTPAIGPRAVVGEVARSLRGLLSAQGVTPDRVRAAGVAAAGLCNPVTGTIIESPNLPEWRDVPFASWLQQDLALPVFIANDANAAALGELRYGAGRGLRDFIYVTVSSGIGGGLVLGGELYAGHSNTAGEVGHIPVEPDGPPCGCGSHGCLEAVASGLALAREASRRLAQGEPSVLLELCRGDTSMVTAELVHQAALRGDGLALELAEQTGRYLGIAFAGLINVLNPEAIIVGGGLSKMGDLLLGPTVRTLRERSYELPARECRITVTPLGDMGGVLGAVALVERALGPDTG